MVTRTLVGPDGVVAVSKILITIRCTSVTLIDV